MQIHLEKTLDVEIVESQLAQLWQQTAGAPDSDDDAAVLRARVANLLVFVANDKALEDVDQMLRELTAVHPSRVLLMLGERTAADRDIEMYVASFFDSEKRTGAKRVCCEEITLKAQGKFVAELPSAALPLLVSDLTIFLWWRDAVKVSDKVFDSLLRASDRLVIDSAEFADPLRELIEANRLFSATNYEQVGISDLNWARLTFWRALLADFYDVPAYQLWLDRIDEVRIDYVAPERAPNTVAPQALLFAGWLASRLRWTLLSESRTDEKNETLSFKLSGEEGREIKLELKRVERAQRKPGRLVQVELRSNGEAPASFVVQRSADGLHLLTEAKLGPKVHRGRVLPVRNRSAAQLLSRELEILCNDQIYQEALEAATRLIDLLS
jgi:glucose-6-phosphate dehydrogenase assembly protein OpcA